MPGLMEGNLLVAMAARSISICLDESLLAELDAQGGNRSAAVSEALSLWLALSRLETLVQAYADLPPLEAGNVTDNLNNPVGLP